MPSPLYEPSAFERLTETGWSEPNVRDHVCQIVEDTDTAFRADELWPAHEWDGWRTTPPLKNLYVGAAGVCWALDALRRRGFAETRLDLPEVVLTVLDQWRESPNWLDGQVLPSRPQSSLFCGEAGSSRSPGR